MPAFAFPAPAGPDGDPLERVTLDDSISTALLLVLETMTPAERVAFVLHDVFAFPFAEIAQIVERSPAACRQLATSARRRVHRTRNQRASTQEHEAVVRAFGTAARTGDITALVAALDPDIVLRSDGGGIVTAARNPVTGADRVSRFLLGVLQKNPSTEVRFQQTPDGLGFAIWKHGRITGIVTLDVRNGLVADLRIMMNPQKLTLW